MEKNINVKIMGVFASILLLFIVITASFAYFGSFDVNLNNNVAVNINAVSPGNATFISNATQLNLQVPAANMSQTASNNEIAAATNTATLTVNLTGAANLLTTCTYDIVYEYDAGSNVYGKSPTTKNGNKEITLQVSNVNGTNNFANEKNFDFDSSWSGLKRTLVSGATISSNGTLTTQNISITGKYYNLTIPQTSIEGKAFTGKIYVTNHSCSTSEIPPAYITLLNAYGGKDNITELPDSAFANQTTPSDKGMYAKADDYTATTGMKSYYYRGAVDNNWVKFGKDSTGKDIYWRIIRINGDGSIRMIYSGTTKPSEDTLVTGSNGVYMLGTGTQIRVDSTITFAFNSSYNKAEYVGYQYIEEQQHGYGKCDGTNNASCTVNGSTVYNSTIKQTIDKWYAGTTLKDNSLVSQDQIFCNDRSASTTQTAAWTSTGADYYYGAYGRLTQTTKSPQLICPTESDKFTVNTSNGNGALTYPVGLITEDEVAMAGGVYGSSNGSYYLYTNQYYWSGSPRYFYGDGSYASEFHVDDGGRIGGSGVDDGGTFGAHFVDYRDGRGARPVVSLSSKAKLSGSGPYSNPYTVSSD